MLLLIKYFIIDLFEKNTDNGIKWYHGRVITLSDEKSRIESKLDIQAYLQELNYALDHGAEVRFQIDRIVDNNRDEQYTNK